MRCPCYEAAGGTDDLPILGKHPDLEANAAVQRIARRFYGGGEEEYVDYPVLRSAGGAA